MMFEQSALEKSKGAVGLMQNQHLATQQSLNSSQLTANRLAK